jgi:cytochrome c-type biogenesis protein CcmH/NrfF
VVGPTTLVTGKPPFWKEAWFAWALAVGGVALAGSLAYQTFRRGGVKKLWRRR